MKTLIAPARAVKSVDQDAMAQPYSGYGGGVTYVPIEDLRTWTGLGVSPETALNAITVLQCVDKIAKTHASLPMFVYRRVPREGGADGREVARDHPLYRTLHDQVNPEMTSFIWRELLWSHVKTWGNHYSEIVRLGNGDVELYPIRPDRIRVLWGTGGRRKYMYLSPLNGETEMKPGSVFHLMGMSSNGLIGMSPIELMRRTIGLARTAETYGESVFHNGARPAIVMTHPQTLSDGAVTRLGAQMDRLRGEGNAGKTVVLEEGTSIAEVGFPPEDAQFMQLRLFQKRELSGYYDVPGLMVGDPDEKETWDDASRRFMAGIQSDLERFEQEAKRQLVLPDEDDIYVEAKAEGFLRADPKARADAHAVEWEHGSLNNDEWRAQENLDPLPNGEGQVYYRPANWVPLGSDPVAVGGDASRQTQFGARAALVDQATRAKAALHMPLMTQFDCPECGKLVARKAAPGTIGWCKSCKSERTLGEESPEPVVIRRRTIERDAGGRLVGIVESVA
jgi:HK97 family phage portal protein